MERFDPETPDNIASTGPLGEFLMHALGIVEDDILYGISAVLILAMITLPISSSLQFEQTEFLQHPDTFRLILWEWPLLGGLVLVLAGTIYLLYRTRRE